MTDTVKAEQYEVETRIYATSGDAGARAVREWVFSQLVAVNTRWPTADGADLAKMQGAALMLSRLLNVIDHGPKIRAEQTKPTGGNNG